MTPFSLYIFWVSLFILFYTYILYALLLKLYLIFKPKPGSPTILESENKPNVSILVACYNEEQFVEQKINNLLELDYPQEKLKIIFVTDGSTDRSKAIIESFIPNTKTEIILYHSIERKGKQHAVNRVMPWIDSEIVVFNDCNTIINKEAIELLTGHFSDPNVGVVSGEKKILVSHSDKVVSSGEGLYWKYESFLKQVDSDFYSCVGSPGELFAIRKDLYEEVPADISIEDFYLSMLIVLKGYRNVYESRAYASEYSSLTLSDEFKRKKRIAAGAFMTMKKLRSIYSLKHSKLLFLYFSHRVLRWSLAPLCLITLLLSNIFLSGFLYDNFLVLQFLFYGLALFGFLFSGMKTRLSILYIPFYFVFMNTALFAGFIDFLRKNNNVVWEKVKRRTDQ